MNNSKLQTPGLVIRETPSKDNNALITILTATHGVVNATAYGARKTGASLAAGTRLFNYAEFTLVEGRGRWKVDATRSIESFFGISRSVEALSCASYFMEVLYDVCVTGDTDTSALRLALNCLFALVTEKKDRELVKAVFELRLISDAGFAPELSECASCGSEEYAAFSVDDACLYCTQCSAFHDTGMHKLFKVTPGVVEAMRYIISAPMEKIFSFTVGDETLHMLCAVCESYVYAQTGRRYDTLKIYHQLTDAVMP